MDVRANSNLAPRMAGNGNSTPNGPLVIIIECNKRDIPLTEDIGSECM